MPHGKRFKANNCPNEEPETDTLNIDLLDGMPSVVIRKIFYCNWGLRYDTGGRFLPKFSVQLDVNLGKEIQEWYPVRRYDNYDKFEDGFYKPHIDVLDHKGRVIKKIILPSSSFKNWNSLLKIAHKDLTQNVIQYIAKFIDSI